MRKRIFPRIVWFLFLYCVVFVLLVTVQFTRRGNFTVKIGDMAISGRYLPSDGASADAENDREKRLLEGGAGIFFGGLEFKLGSVSGSDISFSLIDSKGVKQPALPESAAFSENEAVFYFHGGAELAFAGMNSGNGIQELRISGKFPRGIESMEIPFKPQRSFAVRDSGTDILNITYNGNRYQFSRNLPGLSEGLLSLLPASPAISYRAIAGKKDINPADFIIRQADSLQMYDETVSLWISRSYKVWAQLMADPETANLVDEDMVVAWCAAAIQRGTYRSALSVIPAAFSSDPLRSRDSSVYQFDRKTGVWDKAVRASGAFDQEREKHISRLIAQKDATLLSEEHLIEFLAARGNDPLINDILSFVRTLDSNVVSPDLCPGILECYADVGKWLASLTQLTGQAALALNENPFKSLAEQACRTAAEGLQWAQDGVFVFSENQADICYSLRLGLALCEWGEGTGRSDWAGLGRSLVLSVLMLSDTDAAVTAGTISAGAVPAVLTAGRGREFLPSAEKISSAKLFRLLGSGGYLPHAAATGTNNIWAWTVSSSVAVSQDEKQMDIRVTFPAGETHYVMLRNVKPFALLQIYEINWRSAYDFESYYDSSGWYYFQNERTLVLKIKHRSTVENIRILFTAPRVEAPPPPPPPEEQAETGDQISIQGE